MAMVRKRDLVQLRAAVDRAEEVGREGPEQSRAALQEVKADCARLGIDSAWVNWRLACALDSLGEPDQALEFVERALLIDPLATPFTHSRGIILRSLRGKLAAANAADAGRFYERLARAGEADDEAHLTMARHHAASGKNDAALRLLEALTVLSPACRDAWVELARVARLAGREDQARVAELEAMMLGEGAPAASGNVATA